MELIVGIFIFCMILFIYLHVTFQLRTSNDLEVYELDNVSKSRLEDVCDIRQPVIFDYYNEHVLNAITRRNLEQVYPAFEVKVRDTKDVNKENVSVPLQLRAALKLVNDDKKDGYYSENNGDFLQDTGAIKHMKYNDEHIRPYMVSNCNYDVIFGSENVSTPLRYEINYRNYFYLTEGEAIVKLTAPKSTKYLAEYDDYENFEFRSPINPWNVAPTHVADFDKVKCLEVKLTPGKIMFIPAYWWYSIQFGKETTLAVFRYRTYMNNVAIVPRIAMYFLQNQNIKRNIVRTADTSSPVSTENTPSLQETTIIEEKNETPDKV